MQPETQIELIERLLRQREGGSAPSTESTVPAEVYTSPERLAAEERVLFRNYPLAVARTSEIAQPGQFITVDAGGAPVLVVRDAEDRLRAFLNVCRHRGAKLVTEPCGQIKKQIVCRYHAWAYGLNGELTHLPRPELFPALDRATAGLVELPVAARHGFVWVRPSPGGPLDIDAYLAGIGPDLAGFSVETHRLYRRAVSTRKANWKLVMDAFLEGYHARFLHRQSVARFFADEAVFDRIQLHSRSVGARTTLREAPATPKADWRIRDWGTVFYGVFPNTILVFHPDWLSQITVFPAGTDAVTCVHSMLIPSEPKTDEERAHWEKTFALIDGTVFQKEDLEIAESVQACLRSGANREFKLGGLELPVHWFHAAIEDALAAH